MPASGLLKIAALICAAIGLGIVVVVKMLPEGSIYQVDSL